MSGMQGKAYTLLRHNLIIQIFIDVDCSSITYDTTPSEAILAAAEKAKKRLEDGLIVDVIPHPQYTTEFVNASLANSLLTVLDTEKASDADLKEAFCRDVDIFNFEMEV